MIRILLIDDAEIRETELAFAAEWVTVSGEIFKWLGTTTIAALLLYESKRWRDREPAALRPENETTPPADYAGPQDGGN